MRTRSVMNSEVTRLNRARLMAPSRGRAISVISVSSVAKNVLRLAIFLALIMPAAKVVGQLPEHIELSPVVSRLLDDSVTTESQRRDLALFHGQWDDLEDITPSERAQIAIYRYDLASPDLLHADASKLIRGRALWLQGHAEAAIEMLDGESSAQAILIKSLALEQLGKTKDAVTSLETLRDRLQIQTLTDAAELTAAAQVIVTLARLQGRPAQDYHLVMSLLGKVHGELDPLYWPAYIAEADLLMDKDNGPEAASALQEALQLNPRCSMAWYLLGQLAINGYDFDLANRCRSELRKICSEHLLADLLEARTLLTQKDAESAIQILEVALERYPHHVLLMALTAAAKAMVFDADAMMSTLNDLDRRSPNSPLGYFTVGRFLSMARQYGASEKMLREATRRAGNWPDPRIELGLMLMQRGDETGAMIELRHAVQLDSFNRRASNQLKLAQELQDYQEIRSEHFIIRYRSGLDEVLARDMPQELERIYRYLTKVFNYRPPAPTVIEILPDEKRFAVRITGMPDIWTIAACTGDVIAMTPPRTGVGLGGPFDWKRVIQHEFVHTITLNQTDYRIPHWFTEGCAVSQEPGDRPYSECLLLAKAYARSRLFDLKQINWAFVRPEEPQDRPLAYAQSSWMIEYITEKYGFGAVIKMLEQFREGATTSQAIRYATGQDGQQLMVGFRAWAGEQILTWGLSPKNEEEAAALRQLTSEADGGGDLDRLLVQFPDQPDLLKVAAQRAMANDTADQARRAVLRYASVRPVDPWSDEQMVKLSILTRRTDEAIASLEQLDRQETKSGQWAHQLARIHRTNGQMNLASNAMKRALQREPYHAGYRELAATIYLQADNPSSALRHVEAMAVLEPDRAIHQVRLAALYTRIGQPQNAVKAAKAAKAIDPGAQVEQFLEPSLN